MTSVFISHAAEDTEFAGRLSADLTQGGFEARSFADVLDGPPSPRPSTLDRRILQAIETNMFVVPILTPSSVSSRWVLEEIEATLRVEEQRSSLKLVPVLALECTLPAKLQLRSPADFSTTYAEGLVDLVARLSAPTPAEHASARPFTDPSIEASRRVLEGLKDYLRPSPNDLWELHPQAFEQLVANLLQEKGYRVDLTAGSTDGGVDIVALGAWTADQEPIMIQCKRYRPGKRVGVEVVRSLYGAMMLRGVKRGMIVTTSTFTATAKEAAMVSRDRWNLDLVDMGNLLSWLSQTQSLNSDIRRPLVQIRHRYGELIDKRFLQSLTSDEDEELQQITTALEEAEKQFYSPVVEALRRKRDELAARAETEAESE